MPSPDSNARVDFQRILLTSVILGVIFGGSLIISLTSVIHFRLAAYLAAMCAFHFFEFYLSFLLHYDDTDFQCSFKFPYVI